jgi:predicted secreted protein
MAVINVNGIDLTLSLNGAEIGCADTITMALSTATSTAACRASGGWAENVAGQHSFTLGTGGLIRIATGTDATGNRTYADLMALQIARTTVTFSFGTAIAGGTKYSGTAIITSNEATSPIDGAATFSVSLVGTGPLLVTTNPG